MTAVNVQIDVSDVLRWTQAIDGAIEEIPWTMAGLLNDAAFGARQVIVQDVWPRSVTQRQPNFPGVALHVNKASKQDLHVELVDTLNRAHLKAHAEGGRKVPRGRHLAIPILDANRASGSGIISAGQRPRALIANTPKNRLRVDERGIWVKDVGKHGKWRLRYVFKTSAPIPKDVPFFDAWNEVVAQTMRTGFADAMRKAMRPRR